MRIRVINGPNINMLGIREVGIYGSDTYESMKKSIEDFCKENNVLLDMYQSNHEGDLVDIIQDSYGKFDGLVINPGAYTHTSIAILDALKAVRIPTVEVHISKVEEREDFRQISYVRLACIKTITGHGILGYNEAIAYLLEHHNLREVEK